VYRARDTRLGREVALKVLPHEVTRDPQRLARFEREARSASALNHRNIVTVHDFDSLDGETWLVMELIRGESLREVIARAPLPLKELLPIASGIADGLAAAHAAGLVHRDLKPENVMMTSDGTPKILDFGLVKQAVSDDLQAPTEVQMSRSGMVIGTATYMSPEQARGEPVDFRTDHFAFGLILHELASGKHPFLRSSSIETLAAILNEEPEPLSDTLPEPFVEIVTRCLAKTPADRYGSTADLAHDLRRLRDGGAGSIARRSRAPHPRRWAVAGGLALAALALFAGWIAWRARSAPSIDSIHAEVATPELADVHLGESHLPVTISPDGRYLAVQGISPAGEHVLSLHDLRTGAIRVLAENAFGAGWSTDSRSVAFFSDGKLKTVSIDGGPPRTICDSNPEGQPAWSGETILYFQYSEARGLYRVNSSGGEPQRITGPNELAWWPEFLPDGNHFLYLLFRQASESGKAVAHDLMLGSLDGSPPRKISGQIDSRAVFVDGFLLYVRDGSLLAQPFDPDEARFTGEAKPLLDGLHYFRSTGNAAFSVSRNGLIAWRSARNPARLVWLDRTGREVESIGRAAFVGDGRLSPDGTHYAVGVIDPKPGTADVWNYDLSRQSVERLTFHLHDEKAPVWAPNGTTLYYRSDGGGGPPDNARFRLAAGASDFAYKGPSVEEPQDVSSDGKSLLFV
ncbi:MAG TPA: protein kinase, partial [Thermoanaerobaculia bacterium]|nr:protein kinase [Thermoanaerobaculia bacterium]